MPPCHPCDVGPAIKLLNIRKLSLYQLYCILFYVSFYNSEYTLIKTNMKRFQGLHKTVNLLQNEHAHFER